MFDQFVVENNKPIYFKPKVWKAVINKVVTEIYEFQVYLNMSLLPIDKPAFNAKDAVKAAKDNSGYYKTLTWQERLIVANYLNSVKYNYPENEPPRLDRTIFKMRSRK